MTPTNGRRSIFADMGRLAEALSRLTGLEVRRRRRSEERYLQPLNRGTVQRLMYFRRMLDRVSTVAGDVVECGVGKAKSFQMLALLLYESGQPRTLWGFDSFVGYPEPSPEDASPRNLRAGEWKVITADDTRRILAYTRLPEPFLRKQVRIIPGFFEDTLARQPIESIALLHLDVNLYQSYLTCLGEFFPKVAKGGVVLFDEYMNADEARKCPGAKKAIDEFFRGTPYRPRRDPIYGKYYLVKS